MSGGEGVRNPADLTPVLDSLAELYWELFWGINAILNELTNIDSQLDDIETSIGEILGELDNIDAAIETNRLLILLIEDHILVALGDVADTIDDVLVDTQLLIGRLTADRAGYLDELAAANLPSDVDDLLYDTAAIGHHFDSRTRVYPQDVQATITLACAAVANTFGGWTQIVPIDTIGFIYQVIGVVIEETDAASTYLIQLGYSTVDGDDPITAQIMGERRTRLIGAPIKYEKQILDILGCHAPANAKLWGRIKSASGNADELDVSVVITRHIAVTTEMEHLATWPWA